MRYVMCSASLCMVSAQVCQYVAVQKHSVSRDDSCHVKPCLWLPAALYTQAGTIHSPALVKALFDIYVGPDAVSEDAKRSFGKGLATLLNE